MVVLTHPLTVSLTVSPAAGAAALRPDDLLFPGRCFASRRPITIAQ
jgi:hypothetical protein